MTKHTSGPWEWKSCSGFDYGSTSYWVPKVCTNIDNEADARLIAAAPELLEALISFTKSEYIKHQHPKRYTKALAAITKATGEQP